MGARIRGALGLVVVSIVRVAAWIASRFRGGNRHPDAFYDPPASVPAAPGALLRQEPFTRGLPPGAMGWRVLYTSTRADGTPAVASGLVVVPSPRPDGPLPVIAWAHGTTGVARHCAPSLLDDPFGTGALLVLDRVLAAGWAVVATDYLGLGTAAPHGYLVGAEAARAVLDVVRAAPSVEGVGALGRPVVWGHSQGGGAALWTGQLAQSYAPDVPLLGVAALSPASDLVALAENLAVVRGGAVFASYTIRGMAATYPDIRLEDWVRPGGRSLVRIMAGRGLRGVEVVVGVIAALVAPRPLWSSDPATGALGARLAENVPRGPIDVPLLIGQGLADPLIRPDRQAAYAASLAEAGTAVDYRTYAGFNHTGVVGPDSPLIPELFAWTEARFAETGAVAAD
jgi:acetyl esterase/lipase